jgi:methyl-accepting chemotaxis protein
MDEVTQQNAALVEQAAAAAQSLEEQATSLKDAVSVFEMAPGAAQSAPRMVLPQSKPRLPAPAMHTTRHTPPAKPKVASTTSSDKSGMAVVDTAGGDWQTF